MRTITFPPHRYTSAFGEPPPTYKFKYVLCTHTNNSHSTYVTLYVNNCVHEYNSRFIHRYSPAHGIAIKARPKSTYVYSAHYALVGVPIPTLSCRYISNRKIR